MGSGFPGGSGIKYLPASAGDMGSIPGSGRGPGEGNGNPLQYSCLENPMDRGACQATVHGVAKSWTWLRAHYITVRKCKAAQVKSSGARFKFPSAWLNGQRHWPPRCIFLPFSWGSSSVILLDSPLNKCFLTSIFSPLICNWNPLLSRTESNFTISFIHEWRGLLSLQHFPETLLTLVLVHVGEADGEGSMW